MLLFIVVVNLLFSPRLGSVRLPGSEDCRIDEEIDTGGIPRGHHPDKEQTAGGYPQEEVGGFNRFCHTPLICPETLDG